MKTSQTFTRSFSSPTRRAGLLRPALACLALLLVPALHAIAADNDSAFTGGKTYARSSRNWCVLIEDDHCDPSALHQKVADVQEEDEGLGDIAPKNPTVRPPFAEEVGPPPGSKGQIESITPLPGLPLETSFDNVAWIPEGLAPGKNGDLNIAPDHPVSGCVTALAPNPSDQNVIYIGTANGGVWRTDNALSNTPHWRALTDDQLSLSIGGLALDPNDSTGNTLVAGIGRRSSYYGDGGAQKGLLRTTDGGTTWTRLGETALAGRNIYNLAARGAIILMAVPNTDNSTSPGLYRTTDTGANFQNMSGGTGSGLPAGAVTHLAADSANLTRFYCHVANVGVYRSNDNGATWTNISAGMAAANVGQLALAVGSGGTLFAAELTTTSRVYRSSNQGANWTQMDSIQVNTSYNYNGMAGDPSNANLVYLSGLFTRPDFPYSGRVVRGDASLAAGSQWVSIASTSVQGTGTAPHTDSHALAFTAGSRLIEGDDGGVYELNIANVGSEGTGTGGGGTWRSLNGNLQDSEMHTMAYDSLARIVIGGAQDTGFSEQIASGLPTWNKTSNGDGGDAAVDLLATPGQAIRYGSAQSFGGFYRNTYDANNNLISSAFPSTTLVGSGTAIIAGKSGNMPFVTPIAMNSVAGSRLVIVGNANVYETTDQGDHVSQIEAVAANQLARIAYGGKLNGTNNPDVLFYGVGSNIHYRTTAGGSFTNVAFPGGTVQGIVFDPQNWQNEYIVGTTAVYTATNAGNFVNLTGNRLGVGTFHTIEYLTLPSGNALAVGTDLGVYYMPLTRLAVWTTLGDNLPHAPTFVLNFDAPGQVLVASTLGRGAWLYDLKQTKTTGQYGETFQAYVDGTTTLDARTGELFSNQLGTSTEITDKDQRELALTFNLSTYTRAAFRLPDMDPGRAVPAFSAKWNTIIFGDPSTMADGFSFNFGPLGGISSTAFTDGTYNNEDGFNAGLTVSLRTYSGNSPGFYVRVNGAQVPNGFFSYPSSNWSNNNVTRHFFEVDWRYDTGLTLRLDGLPIFTHLPTPGFAPAVGNRFVFGARTGQFYEELSLDNIAIFTGGVLSPITPTAPYFDSADNPPNETVDKAFDLNSSTKWLTANDTGYVGATVPSGKTIRLYTLTSANDTPGRDPATWDFETSTDGIKWTQHGIQGEQFFSNRFERRAFVVANPSVANRFRLLIAQNHDSPEIQLSEFQPWEFIPVPMQLAVTSVADTGAGSLRQAVANAAPFTGAIINIDPSLTGDTINLTGGPIVLNTPNGVTINAPAIAGGGVVITSNNNGRMLNIPSSASATLNNLTLTGGNATGSFPNSYGGAIYSQGSTTLVNCTLASNHSQTAGGAIYNSAGALNITGCTFSSNSTAYGGAVQNEGNMNVTSSTFAGNTATTEGGAISAPFSSPVSLTQVTISTNSSGTGGGTIGDGFTIINSIIAGNTASIDPNVSGSFTHGGTDILIGDPLLAPLDNYGGITKTMALLPGSPALNNASQSTAVADQRGFPIVGGPDVGAYEAGTLTNYNAYIWETLPATASIAQHATTYDYDGDGMSNYNEFLAFTNAADATSIFRPTAVMRSGSNFSITFLTSANRNYTVEYSFDLVAWTTFSQFAGTGSSVTVPVGPLDPITHLFFVRARVGL